MAEAISRADYDFLRSLLLERAGHELGEGKEYLVDSRLSILAETLKLSGPGAVVDRLRRFRERSVESALVEAMMTGETSFFRNPSVFDRLRTNVLPAIVEARAASRRLRLWSAGCSTGQEPYSLAILLLEEFPEVAAGWDVAIVSTDLAESALRSARLGVYNGVETGRGLSPKRLGQFFEPIGGRWKIAAKVARLVRFERVNLVEPLPFHQEFDLVLLRNVLIYFEADAKRRVFRAVRRTMNDDGYLFLGDSETIIGASEDFTVPPGEMDFYRPAPL